MEFDLGCCKIRQWLLTDKESLVHHANNRNVWINLRDRFPHPYTLKDADDWLNMVVNIIPITQFAIEADNAAIGGIGIIPNEDVNKIQAEIGYWIGEEYWGKGIGTAALKTVTEYAFNNFYFTRLYANVFDWNAPSIRILEKAGYEYEGRLKKSVIKDGRIIDQLIYAKLREV